MTVQIFIFLFGCLGIWFVSRKEDWKRWGYVFGLLGQPFWFYITIRNEQWGMLALTIFYTYSWLQGVYNYFIKMEKTQSQSPINKQYIFEGKSKENLKIVNTTKSIPYPAPQPKKDKCCSCNCKCK